MTLKDNIKSFISFMEEHSDSGATDSEPKGVFWSLLESSFEGEDFSEDFDPEEWQLYEGEEEVAHNLTMRYRALHNDIMDAPNKEVQQARKYFGI